MAFSLRLDSATEATIRRIAAATQRSKASVVRDAIASYAAGQLREASFMKTTLDRLQPFIGVVDTGGQFSTDTHAKYKSSLTRKFRARRSH